MIRHEDGKWKLYTRDGSRVLGTHDTEAEAEEQERTIEWAKKKRENCLIEAYQQSRNSYALQESSEYEAALAKMLSIEKRVDAAKGAAQKKLADELRDEYLAADATVRRIEKERKAAADRQATDARKNVQAQNAQERQPLWDTIQAALKAGKTVWFSTSRVRIPVKDPAHVRFRNGSIEVQERGKWVDGSRSRVEIQ